MGAEQHLKKLNQMQRALRVICSTYRYDIGQCSEAVTITERFGSYFSAEPRYPSAAQPYTTGR